MELLGHKQAIISIGHVNSNSVSTPFQGIWAGSYEIYDPLFKCEVHWSIVDFELHTNLIKASICET